MNAGDIKRDLAISGSNFKDNTNTLNWNKSIRTFSVEEKAATQTDYMLATSGALLFAAVIVVVTYQITLKSAIEDLNESIRTAQAGLESRKNT